MVFLSNPPVEDAAGGEADKSLRLPCGMRSLFLWGYAQKIILGISFICLLVPVFQRGGYFFRMPFRGVGPTGRRLDLEQKFSFMEEH